MQPFTERRREKLLHSNKRNPIFAFFLAFQVFLTRPPYKVSPRDLLHCENHFAACTFFVNTSVKKAVSFAKVRDIKIEGRGLVETRSGSHPGKIFGRPECKTTILLVKGTTKFLSPAQGFRPQKKRRARLAPHNQVKVAGNPAYPVQQSSLRKAKSLYITKAFSQHSQLLTRFWTW